MTAEVQHGFASFQPRARLLKLIGAELISDEVVAVTELVKNAHDADATMVTVRFIGTADESRIEVIDDGLGMDRETLLNGWMEPAGSTKLGLHLRATAKGRRVLGEKGVGRFAADKLGRKLELLSRRKGRAAEIHAVFDWDRFDSDTQMLSDIESRWEIRPAREIQSHGTLLRINGLRTQWTERMFRRLSTRLARLRCPFEDRRDFTIRMESDAFPDYSGELTSDFLDRAPYHIDATFNGADAVRVSINGGPAAMHRWNGPGSLTCGAVRARLYAFDLETEALSKVGPRAEARAWLREWSGVSVYRDGFRVWPYGEPHDDWLRLDQRRVNNPVVRLSNNQVVGFVEITQDGNPELRDQTNREGIVHTQAFEDLRRFLYFALQILEAERQAVRHPAVTTQKERLRSNAAEAADDRLSQLVSKVNGKIGAQLRGAISELKEQNARDKERRQHFLDGYTDLAAVGQAALGLSLESHVVLSQLTSSLADLRASLSRRSESAASLAAVEQGIAAISERLSMLSALEAGTVRRRRTIDVGAELQSFRQLFAPLMSARCIQMRIEQPTNQVVRAEINPQTLRRVLHSLLLNSMDWLHGVEEPLVIASIKASTDKCEVLFSDNGPGIAPEVAKRVFEPMFSLKEGGQGMGLTIARHLMTLAGGTMEALLDRRRRGATIRLALPRKRSRST